MRFRRTPAVCVIGLMLYFVAVIVLAVGLALAILVTIDAFFHWTAPWYGYVALPFIALLAGWCSKEILSVGHDMYQACRDKAEEEMEEEM